MTWHPRLHFSGARAAMEGGHAESVRRSSRERGDWRVASPSKLSGKERGLRAAKEVLNKEHKQADAARKWGLQERVVLYYVRQLEAAGYTPERPPSGSPPLQRPPQHLPQLKRGHLARRWQHLSPMTSHRARMTTLLMMIEWA